jgi:nucleoside-diphosphate-sugar epimerase
MRALIIGGTGLISTGIVKHLLLRGADVTVFNRGQRESTISPKVKQLHGDRSDVSALKAPGTFDVVIDMICFTPQQAQTSLDAFAGRCGHFIFCSTVCTYGVKTPSTVLVDESFPQEPISEYGKNKLICETMFLDSHAAKKINMTIIRPSYTYGPSGSLIDNLEPDAVAWDRIERGLPVLCAGDGLGLWVATHRDDCGKLFAYAAMNHKTFGQSYNATGDRQFTWRDLYRETAAVLGKPARLLFMPAEWIARRDAKRFNLLKEITQFHGAYSSAKAKRDVPEFVCEINYPAGAVETIADIRRRGKWRSSEGDVLYQGMVDRAMEFGVEPVEA